MTRSSSESDRSLRARNEQQCQRLIDRSATLLTDDLDFDDAAAVELAPATIESLTYMRDVEGFTDSYLTGLGAHRTTLADPLVARFLEIWQEEEAGHARAIGQFLDAYAAGRSIDIPPQQAAPAEPASWSARVLAAIGGPVGRVVAAGHMAWGAANELLTFNGYRLLAERCHHPLLSELLRRISAQEARHFSFYVLQAEWRLAASGTARALLRRVLSNAWTPVGVGDGYKTHDEFRRVLTHLALNPAGRRAIERMDRRFSTLPGLGELRIYRQAATRFVV